MVSDTPSCHPKAAPNTALLFSLEGGTASEKHWTFKPGCSGMSRYFQQGSGNTVQSALSDWGMNRALSGRGGALVQVGDHGSQLAGLYLGSCLVKFTLKGPSGSCLSP
jgi:hypothetical protein